MNRLAAASTLIVRKLWTLIAVALVVFALLVSALRYSLPYLDDKKHLLEDYAQEQYGVSLSIAKIDAKWQGSGPVLVLHDVQLKQDNRSPIDLSIDNINVKIHFWDSLITAELRSQHFDLEGLKLNVNVQQIQTSATEFPIIDALENLFLRQLQQFSLTNSSVSIITANNVKSVDVDTLTWLNRGNRHQGKGFMQVAELETNSASFVIDLISDGDVIDGTFYAKADSLDVSPWFNEFSTLSSELEEGRGNVELWADIQDRSITKINGHINPSRFVWNDQENTYNTSIDSGTFVAQPINNVWVANLNDLSITVLEQTFVTSWQASFDSEKRASISLDGTMPMAPLLSFLKMIYSPSTSYLDALQPQATIDTLQMQYSPTTGLSSAVSIYDLGWQRTTQVPGINGISAKLNVYQQHLTIDINNQSLAIDTDGLLSGKHEFASVDMSVDIYKDSENWLLQTRDASVSISELELKTNALFNFDSQHLAVSALIAPLSTNNIKQYLPISVLGQGVTKFLNNAFTTNGQVTGASIVWNGNAANFPFANNQGTFQAQVDITQADFVFSSQWPKISEMDIRLEFVNNDLLMFADKGKLLDVTLSDVNARIPFLSKGADLIIEARSSSNGNQIRQLITNSSLADTLGKTLSKDVLVSNELNALVGLYVPLDNPQATSISGRVAFTDNTVNVPSLYLDLENVAGELRFTNDQLKFSGMQASLLGQPILIDFNSAIADNKYRLDAIVNGEWDTQQSVALIADDLTQFVAGKFKFNAVVNASIQSDGFNYITTLYSELTDAQSALPAPFEKSYEQIKPLRMTVNGDQNASTVAIALDDDIAFDGIIPHKEKQFSRAHLALGQTDFLGLGVGFSISADLPEVNLTPWYQVINALASAKTPNSQKASLLPLPQRIFLEAQTLIVAGQSIQNADITVKRNDTDWLVDVSADEAKAKITLYDQWLEKGIDINADFIRFDRYAAMDQKSTDNAQTISPQSLPPLKFACKQCYILGNNLGEVDFESYPNDDGLRIETIKFEGPNGNLDATGQWHKRNGDHYTFIDGELQSSDFGGLLKDFKFDSGIKDSEAEIDFTFTWKDSPMDFSFEHLDGELDWNLTDGYLTELSDKGSRIFTLLSLESLVRKLSLDFRDVFAKGFFYDKMEGTVQITEGKADTRDTNIDGGAGEMEIYGYTDLVDRQLNYNVNFTPKVTGNLPVLIYFMVNPPTAIAALALDQVLTSTKVISNVNYSITGTIDEPILLETGRKSTEVELPARRDTEDAAQPFIPPSIEDTVNLEINDG